MSASNAERSGHWPPLAIVYAASLAILDVEGDLPDSKIKTLGDARLLDCGARRRRRHR